MPPITKRNKEHLDSMIIGSGHTIMAGFIPSAIKPQEFSENFYQWTKASPETIAQFGFWGGEIDYNTYYPNLSKEELTPKDEEFIEPMFRLLSSTIVSKNYNPTDFGVNGVLKDSMKMLLGQTVNCDHETNIGNAIGAVSKVIWQDAYKDGDFVIPAGINGVLKIDGKANPRIARGILMEPPSIHSNSVTVQFKWDKSHPNMEDNEFYSKLGTYDAKGVMVRRMVTEVVRYLETSLVSHGADSFAQKIGDDGKLVNPEFAKRTWSSYEEYRDDASKQYYFGDFKAINLNKDESNNTQSSFNNNNSNPNNMNELQKFLESLFGEGMLTLGEGLEQNQENAISAIKSLIADKQSANEQLTAVITERDTLTEQVNNLNAEVANLRDMAEVGKTHIQSMRDQAIANYKKLKGDNADETIINMLSAATTGLVTLVSLDKEYQSQLEEKFPLHCAKCGSTDVSRSSSQAEVPETKEDKVDLSEATTQDVIEGLYHKKIQ